MLIIRAIVFYLVYSVSLILYAIPCLIIGPFLAFHTRYRLFLLWGEFVLWWVKVVCGVRYEVIGAENVPSGTFIIMSNHQSPWETLFFYDYFRPVCAILKKELLGIPFFGWGLRMLHPIAIDRSKRSKARRMVLEQGKSRLDEGLSVMIFPEGTRVDAGQRRKFSVGGSELAVAAEAVVLPVTHNAGRFWPGRKLIKHPGTIQVIIGEPVSAAGRDPRELTAEIQTAIYSRLDRIDPSVN